MYSRLENKRIKRKVRENGSRKNRQPESLQERKVIDNVRNSLDKTGEANKCKILTPPLCAVEQGTNHCI